MDRFILAIAFSIELDAQERFALQAPLRQYSEIRDNIVIVRANNYAEICSKKNWQAENDLMEQEAWQIRESMEGCY